MNEIIRDNGWKSKKLWFAAGAIASIFVGAVLAAFLAPIAPLYGDMVGGIVAVTGLFLTGNVANKWVGTKAPMEASVKKGLEAEEAPDDRPKPVMPSEEESP
jgi:hypothetical protein